MVNMNGLSNQTWRNFVKSLEEFDQPVKSAGVPDIVRSDVCGSSVGIHYDWTLPTIIN